MKAIEARMDELCDRGASIADAWLGLPKLMIVLADPTKTEEDLMDEMDRQLDEIERSLPGLN